MMSSLGNTLCRWYSTVRGLMNSRAPISELVSPSRASRAISASCGVSRLMGTAARRRAVSPVADSSRRARSANPSAPNRRQLVAALCSSYRGCGALPQPRSSAKPQASTDANPVTPTPVSTEPHRCRCGRRTKARHRLSRTGNRQLNAALHRHRHSRQARWHPPAKGMIERRKSGGNSGREALRVLKRRLLRCTSDKPHASSGQPIDRQALPAPTRPLTIRSSPDSSHYTVGQEGWEEVADYALDWAVEHAKRPTA